MNDLVESWSAFQKEHPETFDATTLDAPKKAGFYLENRLHRAFMAGADAGRKSAQKECVQNITRAVFGPTD